MRFSILLKKLKKMIKSGKSFRFLIDDHISDDTYLRLVKYAFKHSNKCSMIVDLNKTDIPVIPSAFYVDDYDPLVDSYCD